MKNFLKSFALSFLIYSALLPTDSISAPQNKSDMKASLQSTFNNLVDSYSDFGTSSASLVSPPLTSILYDVGAITPGSGYTNGTYSNVSITGGTGSGAKATIIVSGGHVSSVSITNGGTTPYSFGDILSASSSTIGGTGTGFSFVAAAGHTYVPDTGATTGISEMIVGGADPYLTPGIGPAPSVGNLIVNSNYADSTPGNISNIFAVARNSGTRFTAAVTGVGYIPNGSAGGGNVWGGQFSAIAQGTGAGILTGINDEVDMPAQSAGTTGIALQLVSGKSGPDANLTPSHSFIQFLASALSPSDALLRLQDSATSPISANGCIICGDALNSAVSGAKGIDFRTMHFTGPDFASDGFQVDNTGKGTFNGIQVKDSNGADSFVVKSNAAGTGGSAINFFPGNTTTTQNAEFDAKCVSGAACGTSFRAQGNPPIPFGIHASLDGTSAGCVAIYSKGSETSFVNLCPADGMTASYRLTMPTTLGNVGDVLTLGSGGTTSFSPPPTSAGGTTTNGKIQYIPHTAVGIVAGNVNHISLTTNPNLPYSEGVSLGFFATANNNGLNAVTATVDGVVGNVKMVSGGSLVSPPANAIISGGYYEIHADNSVGWILK